MPTISHLILLAIFLLSVGCSKGAMVKTAMIILHPIDSNKNNTACKRDWRSIQERLDKHDHKNIQMALTSISARDNSLWTRTNTCQSLKLTPSKIYTNGNGTVCRDYKLEIIVTAPEPYLEPYHGTACRNEKGQWSVEL